MPTPKLVRARAPRQAVEGGQSAGQVLKAKGHQTRRRLLDATATLLKTTPMRKLRVAAIAELAGTSPATFYVYFDDVSSAVLALMTDMLERVTGFALAFLDVKTSRELEAFLLSYTAYLKRNALVLRLRNALCDEGDDRFIRARYRSASPLVEVMAARIAERQKQGNLPRRLHPHSTAVTLLAAHERFAIVPSKQVGNKSTREGTQEALAFMAETLFIA